MDKNSIDFYKNARLSCFCESKTTPTATKTSIPIQTATPTSTSTNETSIGTKHIGICTDQ
jgi:hypothetical protein